MLTELGCKETATDHCQPHWAVPLVVQDAVIVHGWIETWGNGIAIPDAQSVITRLHDQANIEQLEHTLCTCILNTFA